ncbi:MAG: carboxypeptidase-like regulatory domain-containing protein [Terracidiphilus sp.]
MLAFLLFALFGMTTITGNAQSTSGTILGTVTDSTGAVVGHTTIQLINSATGARTTTLSNGSGYYQFADVIPGTYTIVVEKQGFKQLTHPGIVLETEARIQVDLPLTVGSSTETVEVTASTPLIEADNVALGTVIDQRETNELPLNGRNAMNLTELVPSVIPLGETSGTPTGMNPFGWGNYQIGGGMAGWSSTYMDGAPDNGIYFNNVEIIPSQDSIAEFKVETNDMSADYGRTGGGVINFVTKSGTNVIHGSAWEFIRNKIFNSNTYFGNQGGPNGTPLPVPAFTQNQYGANFGGPIIIPHLYNGRKRAFFFVNWEGFALREGATYTTTVPDAAAFNNLDLSEWGQTLYDPTTTCANASGCPAGSAIPGKAGLKYTQTLKQGDRLPVGWDTGGSNTQFQSTTPGVSTYVNPTSLAYMKKMWAATAPQAFGVGNFTANATSGGNNYQFVTRLDYDLSDRQHLTGRYTWWDNINLAADPLKNGMCGQGECTEHYRIHNFDLDDTYTMSSKMILDARLSYGRYGYVRNPLDVWTTSDITSIGWPSSYSSLIEFPGPPVFDVPTWDTAGLFSGQGADSTIIDYQDTYHLAGTLTRFIGNHTLKFGAEYTMNKFNYAQTNTSSGLWNFSGSPTSNSSIAANQVSSAGLDIASYFMGYPSSGDSLYSDLIASEENYPAVFVTDDWRATSKLTFHVGARWENVLPFTERHNRISLFNPAASNDALTAAGFSGVKGNVELVDTTERPSRYGVNPDDMEFSPHLGVSYRIAANTVINTGFGLFWLPNYLTTSGNPGWDGSVSIGTPYVYTTNGWTPTNSISTPWPLATPGVASSAYIIMPPGHNLPLYQQDTLGNGVTADIANAPWSYTTQWNFGVQQQFGRSTALDVSYAGATGIHLPINDGGFSIDALPDSYLVTDGINGVAGVNALTDQVTNPYYSAIPAANSLHTPTISRGQSLVPYPEFAGVGATLPVGQSNYEALEVKVQRRFPAGASINVAYTFAKLESDTDTISSWLETVTGVGDVNNLKGEKSLSSNDAPQRLVVAYVYDIPVGQGKALLPNISRAAGEVIGGWGLQGLTTLMKGFPLGISERIDAIGTTNNGGSRPDVVPGCNKTIGGSAVKKLNEWFNTSCFTESPPYVWGNESRNDSTLEAPGLANWDLSIVKKFPISPEGRVNLQFRSEFYNLFNRVQFGYPNTQFDATSGAAQITSQSNLPRVMQFALRINY